MFRQERQTFPRARLELSSPSKEDNILAKFCHSAPLLLLIGIRWTDWGHRLRPCGSTAPRRRRTMFSLWQVCHNISKAEAEANFINELGSQQKEVDTLPSNTGMYILCMYVYIVCMYMYTYIRSRRFSNECGELRAPQWRRRQIGSQGWYEYARIITETIEK